MSRKLIAGITAVLVSAGASGFALDRATTSDPKPLGLIARAAVTGPSGPLCLSVPGKAWGSQTTTTKVGAITYTQTVKQLWHYSLKILKPTRIETACITQRATGGTLARVSVSAVPATP